MTSKTYCTKAEFIFQVKKSQKALAYVASLLKLRNKVCFILRIQKQLKKETTYLKANLDLINKVKRKKIYQ